MTPRWQGLHALTAMTGTLDSMNLRARFVDIVHRAVADLLELLDRSRVTPQGVARHALDQLEQRRTVAAAADPTWAAIQSRREGGRILVGDGVVFADSQQQRDIELELVPNPFWYTAVSWLSRRSYADAYRSRVARRQRARRGWSDSDVWELNTYLCTTLSSQLAQLARRAHGWPGENSAWPTFEDWTADLRWQSARLARYVESSELDTATNTVFALLTERDADPDALAAAREERDRVEQELLQDAQLALHWVADNIAYLWD